MAEKWYLYSDKVNDALKGIDISAKLNNPINDSAFAQEPTVESDRNIFELSPEELKLFREMKAKDHIIEKCEKWADHDINDPNLHFQTKKAMEANIEYINLYKKLKAENRSKDFEIV